MFKHIKLQQQPEMFAKKKEKEKNVSTSTTTTIHTHICMYTKRNRSKWKMLFVAYTAHTLDLTPHVNIYSTLPLYS